MNSNLLITETGVMAIHDRLVQKDSLGSRTITDIAHGASFNLDSS
jgi:hypothetical protein